MIGERDLDLNDRKAMARWLGRLLDMPASMFSDDTLEELRWDIAHYFLDIGCAWNAAMVVAGDLTPHQHGRRAESDALYELVRSLYERQQKVAKEDFVALLRAKYDCLNPEVTPCEA